MQEVENLLQGQSLMITIIFNNVLGFNMSKIIISFSFYFKNVDFIGVIFLGASSRCFKCFLMCDVDEF
jgi:hypothetical protein